MQAGRGSGWPLLASSCATAASTRPASRASACRNVVSSLRVEAGCARGRQRSSGGLEVVADDQVVYARKARVARLGRLGDLAGHTAPQAIDDRRGGFGRHAVALQHRVGIGERAGVGHGRAGADHVERAADHIGENKRDHAGRVRQPRQPAALDLIEVLAQRVDLVDIRPAAQQHAASV